MSRLLALLLALTATPAAAWWDYGHETVAGIAYARVAPVTRARVDALLRQHRLLETPTCPARTIEQASIWADCIKGLKERFSYQNSWHYQNVDVCKPFDLKAACRDGNCVSAQILRNTALLKDRTLPPRERVMALAFLVHFVGDLHMPLHAGDRGDRGGNDVKASYGLFAGSRLNLHAIWDGYLAERAISTPKGGVQGLLQEATGEEAGADVEAWSRESWAVSRDMAYGVALGDPCATRPERVAVDEAKIATLIPVVRRQVLRGGLRLASLLDEALGTGSAAEASARR